MTEPTVDQGAFAIALELQAREFRLIAEMLEIGAPHVRAGTIPQELVAEARELAAKMGFHATGLASAANSLRTLGISKALGGGTQGEVADATPLAELFATGLVSAAATIEGVSAVMMNHAVDLRAGRSTARGTFGTWWRARRIARHLEALHRELGRLIVAVPPSVEG